MPQDTLLHVHLAFRKGPCGTFISKTAQIHFQVLCVLGSQRDQYQFTAMAHRRLQKKVDMYSTYSNVRCTHRTLTEFVAFGLAQYSITP